MSTAGGPTDPPRRARRRLKPAAPARTNTAALVWAAVALAIAAACLLQATTPAHAADAAPTPATSGWILLALAPLLVIAVALLVVDMLARPVTFEQEFFPHVVMPDGGTVYEHARGAVAIAHEKGEAPALLPQVQGSGG